MITDVLNVVATAVTTPVNPLELIEAVLGVALVHVPPPTVLDNVVRLPVHAARVPVMAVGAVTTVAVLIA